ncbi:pyridoxamine 5'-phosphate oxidase [Candidatus Competibacter phosphatis]|uniref:Pyridoxamine 5'-phosphate oxidase n=1 Tax=Candidatus Competibacter phosphatis TaxID=221280 RepID=A0ABX1TLA8_9GAMM|nr:pyridoxamine 5'-phosphate oxidase family protein [Candidatus Competibacter phosphatis]NMQ19220.1 pyridoxamine 5'-phosphate oxidase [Candidatus Competibacter phosphatis]
MNLQEQRLMLTLIRDRRWAALATQGPDGPDASWVAYVPEPDCSGFLLHLSTLSAHTRNLLTHPRAGLTISEPERDDEDPQTLARVTIQGEIATIPHDHPDYPSAALCYQERLPASVPRFEFGDFLLLRLIPVRVRFIGGFARAYTLDYDGLRASAQCTS